MLEDKEFLAIWKACFFQFGQFLFSIYYIFKNVKVRRKIYWINNDKKNDHNNSLNLYNAALSNIVKDLCYVWLNCERTIGCIQAITRNSPEFVIGQIICNESTDMCTHAVSEHVYVLYPRASWMISQVFHQLSDALGAEIRTPGDLRETGLAYQRTVIHDYNIIIASREIRWNWTWWYGYFGWMAILCCGLFNVSNFLFLPM